MLEERYQSLDIHGKSVTCCICHYLVDETQLVNQKHVYLSLESTNFPKPTILHSNERERERKLRDNANTTVMLDAKDWLKAISSPQRLATDQFATTISSDAFKLQTL